ncbi:small ubiquitin-related modifier 2-like [Olea europaea subsp. europaea]|uniref:Small ubiquitin-related modifier 2-like n=1 Tax=Olea europaea subsp. europaea TaxID=158383 RepID=A0A8S0V4Y6_OLEEU|nr:small ubiquitin-related modifier 2-like [Olea europaea subsp. europaea]
MAVNSNGKRPLEMPIDHPKIKLCIKTQDGDEVYYRVRRDRKIHSLLMAYCKEKNFEYEVMRFVYDGRRLDVKKTPDEIGMEDEDSIDAFTHGSGGGYLTMTLG